MKRVLYTIISIAILSTVALSGCTSQAFSALGQIATRSGNDDVANAFNTMSKAA